jgi:putative Holliday junction resolvase
MGIDYGDSRIGIAMSDPLGWMAQGIETIEWHDNMKKPVVRIQQLVKEYGVEKVVVGFPRNMNGTVGPRGEKTLEFVKALTGYIDIDIMKWDERLSTVAANRIMHEVGMKTSKKKKVVDQIAAVFILQGYLNSLGSA